MSLERKVEPQPISTLAEPQQDLGRLWEKIQLLRESDRQSAEDKLQVSLLLATTEKLCRTLTSFMTATENELRKMNAEQLKLLNIQEQYKGEIRKSVDKILADTYGSIQENQQDTFDSMLADLKVISDRMIDEISDCAKKCSGISTTAETSIKKLCKITCIEDLLYYLCPLLVLGDVVLRLIEVFS